MSKVNSKLRVFIPKYLSGIIPCVSIAVVPECTQSFGGPALVDWIGWGEVQNPFSTTHLQVESYFGALKLLKGT